MIRPLVVAWRWWRVERTRHALARQTNAYRNAMDALQRATDEAKGRDD